MSGVAVVYSLLSSALPGYSVTSGVTPLGAALPALSIATVSGAPVFRPAKRTGAQPVRERVQVTAQAMTLAAAKQALDAARAAIPQSPGTVAGVAVDSILPDADGPDLWDQPSGIYSQSTDFMVVFPR